MFSTLPFSPQKRHRTRPHPPNRTDTISIPPQRAPPQPLPGAWPPSPRSPPPSQPSPRLSRSRIPRFSFSIPFAPATPPLSCSGCTSTPVTSSFASMTDSPSTTTIGPMAPMTRTKPSPTTTSPSEPIASPPTNARPPLPLCRLPPLRYRPHAALVTRPAWDDPPRTKRVGTVGASRLALPGTVPACPTYASPARSRASAKRAARLRVGCKHELDASRVDIDGITQRCLDSAGHFNERLLLIII